jgi:hypothetical protein
MADQQNLPRISVVCPHCGARAKAPAHYVGRRVKCAAATCGQSFVVPPADAPTEPAPSSTTADNAYLAGSEIHERVPVANPTGETFASNPGQVPFNLLRYWRHKPLGILLGGGFAVVTLVVWLALVASGHSGAIPTKDGGETPIWLFGLAALATTAYFGWLESRKFRSGDANPGIVVSLNPTLIAVATDLTQGEGEFPAVKILKINMTTQAGRPLAVGMVVPTVAVYASAPNSGAGHWGDFYPQPAEYATADPQVLERLIDSFPRWQLDFLRAAIKTIKQPFAPGLYAMWPAPGKPPGRRIKSGKDF